MDDVMEELKPLIAEARAKGHWLHAPHQDIWLSPDELEDASRQGQFRFGVASWRVRYPRERLDYLTRAADESKRKRDEFAARLRAAGLL